MVLGGSVISEVVSDLYVYAEVAVALAGFAAIVGSLEQRNSAELSTLRKSAYHSLLSSALLLVFFAFLPIWLNYWFEDPAPVWRICFGVFVIAQAFSVYIYFSTSKIDHSKYAQTNIFVRMMAYSEYVFFIVGQGINLAAIACVFGFLQSYYPQIYFTILTYQLVLSLTGFLVLVTFKGEDNST